LQRLQCCQTSLSYAFVPICSCIELRFSCLVWSTDCDVGMTLVAISLSCCRTDRLSNSRPGIALARRMNRRVGSLGEGVSIAFDGQWLNWDMILWTCACAVNPLSVFLSIVVVRCSTSI
jgi:hypothetical protein